MSTSRQEKLSVLHVSTALSWRGGEQQVAYLVSELKKFHINQFVLCSNDSAMEKFCTGNGIPFFTASKGSSLDIFYAKKLAGICKNEKITIVHTHDSHAHTFAILAVMILGCKSKIIVSRRVDFEIGSNPFSNFKYNHTSVKRILCVSEAIRKITAKSVRDQSRLITIHSGIDLSRFGNKANSMILHKQYFLSENTKIIANVSAIAPHKDYITFVNTVAILKDKLNDIAYFIIGDGPDRSKIEKYIKECQLEQVIFLTGFRNDVADIFPEIDLLLMTSETEGLGTSIIDAFACGVPVVATSAGGIPEIVIHEQTGLLAGIKDAPALASAVSRIMNNAELKESLVQGACRHLKDFSTTSTASKTLHEYHAVAGFVL